MKPDCPLYLLLYLLFHFDLYSVDSPLYHSFMKKHLDSSLLYFHASLASYQSNVAAF